MLSKVGTALRSPANGQVDGRARWGERISSRHAWSPSCVIASHWSAATFRVAGRYRAGTVAGRLRTCTKRPAGEPTNVVRRALARERLEVAIPREVGVGLAGARAGALGWTDRRLARPLSTPASAAQGRNHGPC